MSGGPGVLGDCGCGDPDMRPSALARRSRPSRVVLDDTSGFAPGQCAVAAPTVGA